MERTLVWLQTGFGKSICYPTLLFVFDKMSRKCAAGGSVVVVVSPSGQLEETGGQCSRCSSMWPRRRHLHPPTYEYVFRLRIIKHMRKQWKPGPFLLPFSGLGTRLAFPMSCEVSLYYIRLHGTIFSPTSSVIMCRKISSTKLKLWLEAMWPYISLLSTCNINAVVITCMPTYIHTPPFLIFTGGDPGNGARHHSFSSYTKSLHASGNSQKR